jgi:hypothetical protein
MFRLRSQWIPKNIIISNIISDGSCWLWGLRRGFAAACLVGLRVRILPAGMDVRLLWMMCVFRYNSVRRADQSSGGALPSVVRNWVWSWSLDLGAVEPWGGGEKCYHWGGRDISVSITTHYGTDGPGIESLWGREFPCPSRRAPRPTQSPAQWLLSFPRAERPGRVLTTPPPLFSAEFANRLVLYLVLPCVPAKVCNGVTFTIT